MAASTAIRTAKSPRSRVQSPRLVTSARHRAQRRHPTRRRWFSARSWSPTPAILVAVTTFDAIQLVVSILLAGACVAMIVLAAVVFVRSRRAGTVRLFGIAVHRPGLWALALVCLGVSGLVRMSSEVTPNSWQKPTSLIDLVLTLAFVVLIVTHSLSLHRARPRRGP